MIQSVQPLAMLALKETGADGYAIHRVDPKTQARELKFAWGVPVPESGETGFAVTLFPLRAGAEITGVLAFVFRAPAISPRAQHLLKRISIVIEVVWRLTLLPEIYARDAARIGELEATLADSKIADRARGLLASAQLCDATETIVRHTESVLRPSQLRTTLGQLGKEIEQEIAERELASRAKAILQSRFGMSENQAHVHLRLVSRKSRKRMRDVAQDVLEQPLVQRTR